MNSRIFDTNIVSYWIKRHPLERRYRKYMVGCQLFVSFQTFAELLGWSMRANWGSAKQHDFDSKVQTLAVIQSDEVICIEWARIRHLTIRQPMSVSDAWIAATALAYNLELVTHNPADFANVPWLTVISETP